MQLRSLTLLLLGGCYFPGEALIDAANVELAPRAVMRSGERSLSARMCEHASCYDFRTDQAGLNERTVGIATGKPDPAQQPSLEVELPVSVLDCSNVGLTVVGPWQAKVGETIMLHVLVRGLDGTGESPPLSWETTAGELTELGPSTAEVQCSVPGANSVSVALAPPAPCPSQIELAISCQSPAAE